MSSDENKFLNNARDFKKANPNATEYDFLDVDNYYKIRRLNNIVPTMLYGR